MKSREDHRFAELRPRPVRQRHWLLVVVSLCLLAAGLALIGCRPTDSDLPPRTENLPPSGRHEPSASPAPSPPPLPVQSADFEEQQTSPPPSSDKRSDEWARLHKALLSNATPDEHRTQIDELMRRVDTDMDDWDTEATHESVNKQFKVLARLIKQLPRIELEHVSGLVSDKFACASNAFRPTPLDEVFDDGMIHVRRFNADGVRPPDTKRDSVANTYSGHSGLVRALRYLVQGLGKENNARIGASFKPFGVEVSASHVTTQAYFESHGQGRNGVVQLNAIWHCAWSLPSKSTKPRLLSVDVTSFEEIMTRVPRGTLFTDCTASAMQANASYKLQVLRGTNYWLPRISKAVHFSFDGHHGVAVGDVNGDGLEDIYVSDTGGLPNRLYVQNPDGTVTDVSAQAGLDFLDIASSALLVDLDNDGDQDLAIAAENLMLLQNDGRGTFTLKGGGGVVEDSRSLSAVDYDDDGDLDLYLTSYHGDPRVVPLTPIPYHDANNGSGNSLLRNDGEFRFADVTSACGLDANNTRFSFAAAWEDFDNDGDMDLYVANDYGRNNLYRNDEGHFTDIAAAAGVEDSASGMSVSWGDYNCDGLMDLYVSNMWSSAGNRVTFQRRFGAGRSDTSTKLLQRYARGNTLYLNAGRGKFHDRSVAAGVTMGRWAWASKFADINNDGWPDLVVANGQFTSEDTQDL